MAVDDDGRSWECSRSTISPRGSPRERRRRCSRAEPFIRWDWVRDHPDDIRSNFWEHAQLTVLAVGIGFVIAMGMALIAVRWRALYEPLAAFCAGLYSVPSVALFAPLLPFVGLGMGNRSRW